MACYTQHMKLQHLITAALFVAPLCQAVQEVPFTDEAADAAEAAMMQQALQDHVRCLKSVCELVEGIHDKASAEAALPKIKTRMTLIADLSFALGYMDEAELIKAHTAAGVGVDRVEAAVSGLEKNRFYGCMELAKVFGYPASAVLQPGEVTPALLQTLGAELKAALGSKINGISGGPGFTEQTAWKMGSNPENLMLIATIMEALPGAEKEDQTLVRTEEGPIYGRMTYTLPKDGKVYRLQMWFDITEIMKAEEAATAQEETEEYTEEETPEEKPVVAVTPEPVTLEEPEEDLPLPQTISIYTAEEKAAIMQQYVQLFKETVELTSQITDRASADAAAPQVKELTAKSAALPVDFSHISAMDILEEMEKNGVNPYMIQQNMHRIREADFYGSEALEHAMRIR